MITQTLRTLRYLRPAQPLHRLWRRARAPWFASGFYRPTTEIPNIGRFPAAIWPGDPANGDRILGGSNRLIGQERPFAPPFDWQPADASMLWVFTLNYFEWLADLECTGKPEAAPLARNAIEDWIENHRNIAGPVWHPYPVSLRLVSWLKQAPFVLAGADETFRKAFAASLACHARHLVRVLELDVGGNHLIKNLKALMTAGVCLDGFDSLADDALCRLKGALARQILPDGCHEERSPAYHVQVLADLVDVRSVVAMKSDVPDWLDTAIERMAAVVPHLRHGDGGLALFNDGEVGDVRLLTVLENTLNGFPAPQPVLKDGGYGRLEAGSTVAIMDAGRCCPDDLPAHAHADALSFELSDGPRRLVVNCGTFAYQDAQWRNRLRGTAAQSTVSLGDEDSAEVYGVFRLGRRPRNVELTRAVSEDGITLDAAHDGYRHLGVRHQRSLSLSADGNRLDGVDTFVGRPRSDGPMIARFHLAPDVEASVEGNRVHLNLSGGPQWTFEASDGVVNVEPSVYAPRFYEMHETRQIRVTKVLTDGETRISWRLRRASA